MKLHHGDHRRPVPCGVLPALQYCTLRVGGVPVVVQTPAPIFIEHGTNLVLIVSRKIEQIVQLRPREPRLLNHVSVRNI